MPAASFPFSLCFLHFSLDFHATFFLSAPPLLSLSLQVDRLMELHFKYLEAVQQADKRIEGEKHVSIPPFFFLFPSFTHPFPPFESVPSLRTLTSYHVGSMCSCQTFKAAEIFCFFFFTLHTWSKFICWRGIFLESDSTEMTGNNGVGGGWWGRLANWNQTAVFSTTFQSGGHQDSEGVLHRAIDWIESMNCQVELMEAE